MTDMFRIEIIVRELFDNEFKKISGQSKAFVGIDRLLETLALLTNRSIDDIEDLKKHYNKGLRC